MKIIYKISLSILLILVLILACIYFVTNKELFDGDECATNVDDQGKLTITGTGDCSNLRLLDLSNRTLTDISALANVTNIVVLNLSNTQINLNDISEISSLHDNLESLFLNNNKIKIEATDIPNLSSFTNLHLLSLINNDIRELSFILGLNNLKALFIENNKKLPVDEINKLTDLSMADHNDGLILNLDINLLNDLDSGFKGKIIGLFLNCNFDDLDDFSDFTLLDIIILHNIENTNINNIFINNAPEKLRKINLVDPCIEVNIDHLNNSFSNITVSEMNIDILSNFVRDEVDKDIILYTFDIIFNNYKCKRSTTPMVTTPQVTTPQVTTPMVTTLQVTTPQVEVTEVTTPQVEVTEVTTPHISKPNYIYDGDCKDECYDLRNSKLVCECINCCDSVNKNCPENIKLLTELFRFGDTIDCKNMHLFDE
jgi:hypothetical protein